MYRLSSEKTHTQIQTQVFVCVFLNKYDILNISYSPIQMNFVIQTCMNLYRYKQNILVNPLIRSIKFREVFEG